MMHYTVNTLSGEHLGFLVMVADDDDHPDSGLCMVKVQTVNETAARLPETMALADLAQHQALTWQVADRQVWLCDADQIRQGCLKDGYLHLGRIVLQLNDLTGMI